MTSPTCWALTGPKTSEPAVSIARTPSVSLSLFMSRALPEGGILAPSALGRHLRPHLGAQHVDGGQALVGAEVPVGPAVAGRGGLGQRPQLVDRAGERAHAEAAVGADRGGLFAAGRVDQVAGA